MEGMQQWALLVMLDLLKGWPVVQVSCHVPTAVVSFRAKRGSLSMVTACSRRPTIKIMCLSREGKHAGTEKKVLLARGQIIMLEAGIVVNSNTLAEKLLGRSSEAIKKMRQSEEYKRIL